MSRDYELTGIGVQSFKKLQSVTVKLAGLNLAVGGNNAGKSSLLQAIHFAVSVATARRISEKETFSQDALLYCPSSDFTSLRHGLPYSNQTHKGSMTFHARTAQQLQVDYKISIYRGRNAGNVGCERSGDTRLGQLINDPIKPFSVYVPGLAGIPRVEEFRSEGVVRRGVAGGDANLYLRNVLLLIKQAEKLPLLLKQMAQVFPRFKLSISFRPKSDVGIDVRVSDGSQDVPIDLAGTGVLQALQIFSYITLFEPTVLLLDEPDAHLHANNQVALARALIHAAKSTDTQIICSTHSRNLVEALTDEAQFIWLRDGQIAEQGTYIPIVPLLMEIGAFDSLDKIKGGQTDWFILSEDSDMEMLHILFEQAGFVLNRCEFRSYGTSSKLESALALATYLREVWPHTRVVIHRDRDFMTDEEVAIVSEKISAAGAIPFITRECDVEGYFVEPAHVALILSADVPATTLWLEQVALAHAVEVTLTFVRKRDEIKHSLYRGRTDDAPDTAALMGSQLPLPQSKRRGKDMLKWCRSNISLHGKNFELVARSASLNVADLVAIRTSLTSISNCPAPVVSAIPPLAQPFVPPPAPAPPVAAIANLAAGCAPVITASEA